MSHLRKRVRRDGTVTYDLYWWENGKLTGKNASDDVRTARRIQNDLDRRLDHQMWGLPTPLQEITFDEFCEKYLDKIKQRKNSNWQVVQYAIEDLKEKTGITALRQFNKTTLKDYADACERDGRAPGGINRYLHVFTNMGTMMVEWHHAHQNPTAGLKLVRGENSREIKYLTLEEIKEYFAASWSHFTVFGMISVNTGFRPTETLYIQYGNFDLEHNLVHVHEKPELNWQPKNHERRAVPLLPELKKFILENFRGSRKDKFLLTAGTGKPYTEGGFRAMMDKAIKPKLNIPELVPYTFRHTYAAHTLFRTRDIYGLSKLLGHKSFNTTIKYYAHLLKDYHEKALGEMSLGLQDVRATLNPNSHPHRN